MNISDIIEWLSPCPVLAGEVLIPHFLPTHKGWCAAIDRQQVLTDILGNRSTRITLKITRRLTVPDSDARLAVFSDLEALAAWAAANPPETGTVRVTGLPEFQSRAASGTEDISVTITLETDAA